MSQDQEKYEHQITPRYSAWTEDEKLVIQIILPGVKKETIQMKALKDYFTLRANRDKILYTLDVDLGLEIEPTKTSAKYEEGLLRVELKRFNPLEHAYLVPIQ